MGFELKENQRREKFLTQYFYTAQTAFVGKHSGWRLSAAQKLVELAKPTLGYPPETPPLVVYRSLAYVWHKMGLRQKKWHGAIKLAPADIEEY